jgi:hypothetical protein
MKYNRIAVFDFDKTLITTCEPEEGRKVWFQKKGNIYPHKGWWSKPETLDTNVFDFDVNKYTLDHYKEETNKENTHVYLATGRLSKLKTEVNNILNKFDLKFKEIYCNTGGETIDFKKDLFESLIKLHSNTIEFVIYEDRHFDEFILWAKNMESEYNIKFYIYDCINEIKIYQTYPAVG